MDMRGDGGVGLYARILALASLLIGLGDAARLVGLDGAEISPIARLGGTGFTLLAIFCIMRLFASVGLWVRGRWGAVLLASATGVELALSIFSHAWVALGLTDFVFKVLVFAATIGLLLLTRLSLRRQLAD